MIHYRFNPSTGMWEESYYNAYSYDNNLKIKEHLIWIVKPGDFARSGLYLLKVYTTSENITLRVIIK